jgi:hydroxyacylglutathione hydrolase
MRIDGRIHLVGGGTFGISHFSDANIYAVDCEESTVLVDAGCGIADDVLARNIDAEGLPPVSHILLTHSHWDHARGVSGLKDLLSAQAAGHAAVARELEDGLWASSYAARKGARPVRPTSLDVVVDDGFALRLGPVTFTAVATPGHTSDSVCYLTTDVDRGTQALFTGDTVTGEATLGTCSLETDFRALHRSVKRLATLNVDMLLPGHRAFSVRGGRVQIAIVLSLLRDAWGTIIPGFSPLLPTWWLQHDPRQILGWTVD